MVEYATRTDWVWVEAMIMQAMVGRVVPELLTVALKEEPDEWVITFYANAGISEAEQQDIIEIAGYAESFLSECVPEQIHATPALHRSLRGELFFVRPPSISSWIGRERERLLFCTNPSRHSD